MARMTRTEQQRKWRNKNRALARQINRKSYIKRRYGVSLDWFNATLKAQGGGCAICGRKAHDPVKQPERKKKLERGWFCIDHSHSSGKVRGLICTPCNSALERVETIPDWPERARRYLGQFADEED